MARSDRPRVASALDEIESRIDANTLLTEEDKDGARLKAREHVLKHRKEKAMDEYLALQIEKEERALQPEEQYVDIHIDLPKFAHFINIDNVGYYHGLVYSVPLSKARSMNEQMAVSWAHQREIEGQRRRGDDVRTPRELKLSPSMASLPAATINRSILPRV